MQAEEAKQPEKVEFMWDDYHRQQLEEIAEEDDEDWDDDWTKMTKKALSSFTSVNQQNPGHVPGLLRAH
ncbi:hypothetical protein ACLK1Z_18255 [Escherichia coli]